MKGRDRLAAYLPIRLQRVNYAACFRLRRANQPQASETGGEERQEQTDKYGEVFGTQVRALYFELLDSLSLFSTLKPSSAS